MKIPKPKFPKGLQRLKLPIVKSRKPGTLKLTNQMIADYEAALDAGKQI
jgi:hypothetical protein